MEETIEIPIYLDFDGSAEPIGYVSIEKKYRYAFPEHSLSPAVFFDKEKVPMKTGVLSFGLVRTESYINAYQEFRKEKSVDQSSTK